MSIPPRDLTSVTFFIEVMCKMAASDAPKPDEFSYLSKYGSRKQHRMPTTFDKCNFKPGQSFRCRMSQIYDPSKFWIVVKYRELELFQKYLFKWYYMNGNRYRIPEEKIEKELYCVALTDGGYYRGVIVGFACDFHETQDGIQVYFIDYGLVKMVELSGIFYLNEKCVEVPEFAVRASLAGICPRSRVWTSENVMEFHRLVSDTVLVGVVINVDSDRQHIELNLSAEKNGIMTIPVHKILVSEKHARYFDNPPKVVHDVGPLVPKLEFPYLFPSHEAIESGKVPVNISDAEYQLQIGSLSSILSRYYTYKDTLS